ncbi:outer membrane protein assembly factor BamB family protein [Streptomyces roseicoloratus]|uniref:outer membrane protein assembly factor BamB family protein n=1 Tax=Streptomyces roseicoloratus TaxID=2508722 RepID=UPI0035A60601
MPQNAAQRPAGWKPWRAKLTAPAFGCSAGETVLVCRTTDGRFEALDTANGGRLWTADLVADPRDNRSFIGPTGAVFVAGSTGVPAVHGSSVALMSAGRLQVRDARGGGVRWEQESMEGGGFRSQPVVGDDMVFVPTQDDAGVSLTAFALADGRRLWSKSLTNADLSRAEFRDFEPVAYANGLVYALSDAGFVSFDARTGEQRGQVASEAVGCATLHVQGRSAYCAPLSASNTAPLVLHRLDATTLAPVGDGHVAVPAGVARSGAWPTAVSARAVVVLDQGPMRWAALSDTAAPIGVHVLDLATGRSLGHFPAGGLATETVKGQRLSDPLLTDRGLLYADFSSLRFVPLGEDGRPGTERTVPLPGAPGPRTESLYDRAGGIDMALEIRPPVVLPVGGVAHVVYDQGVVVSAELPDQKE